MKELSIEEKAKRYDEALKVLHKYDGANIMFSQSLKEELFPELKESEDEKVRKELLEHCKNQAKPYIQTGNKCPQIQSWIAWLEKQGEQKPAWSEEDERYINIAVSAFSSPSLDRLYHYNKVSSNDLINWLKSLKDRVQPKQEWGEEDEVGLANVMWAIKQARTIAKDENDMGNLWYAERWLKSLRPQSRWRPSDEQLKQLGKYCIDNTALTSLYEYLKQL